MRLGRSRSKNSETLYMIKSTYEEGKNSSKIVERLGSPEEIAAKHPGVDPYQWAKGYIAEATAKEKAGRAEVIARFSPAKLLEKDRRQLFGGGYLFLQRIYHDLGLPAICEEISSRHKFDFDLDEVLSRLIYGRILHPASKLATHKFSSTLIEGSRFELHHTYRALEVLATESDFIQSELYRRSKKVCCRNDAILYYDCTNYFFEIEEENGLKQYGHGKDHRPTPIVQMGLFMDGDGLPLAFCITPGNTNEQTTLIPLEKKILSDFCHAKFVVCTDAGLSSTANRKFNDAHDRAFITTQSVKGLKGYLKDWALETGGWQLPGSDKTYDITALDEERYYDRVFYKERWIKEAGLEQRLLVTYSLKYRNYERQIRARQIQRAQAMLEKNPSQISRASATDSKRFISQTSLTGDGEIADKRIYRIDEAKIAKEEAFDGFYGVCTNLTDPPEAIVAVNRRRWQIEECFRIMKHELKARPAYLSRDDRIAAHFMTCFIALMLYRLLEKRLADAFTTTEIIDGLRSMDFLKVKGEGYLPAYTRTDFTDALHEAFGFRTDTQIVTTAQMRRIVKMTRK